VARERRLRVTPPSSPTTSCAVCVKDRAIHWLLRAAHAAFEAGGLEAAVALSTRASSSAPWVKSAAHFSSSSRARRRGAASITPAPINCERPSSSCRQGGLFWWSAISALIWTAAAVGRPEEAIPYVQLAFTTRPAELSGLYGEAVLGLVTGMFSVGQVGLARSFLAQFDALGEGDGLLDPGLRRLDRRRSLRGLVQSALRGAVPTRVGAPVGPKELR